MTRLIRHSVTAAILLLASVSLALGASVTIDSSNASNGIFTVQGSNMDGVSGFDLVLNYDSTVLASPSVSQGSLVTGAMFAANPNYSKNSIKIAAVSTNSLPSSGQIATITFATHTGTGKGVTVASFNPIDGNGVTVSNPTSDTGGGGGGGTTTTTTTPSTTTTPTTTPTSGSSGATYLGTVTMPSDSQPQNESKPASAPETTAKPADTPASAEAPVSSEAPAPRETPAPAKPAAAPKKAAAIGTVTNTSVLERFRAYQGVKTPAVMIALFKQPISPSFSQQPFVALSDGMTTVTVIADLPAEAGISPNFALNHAKLLSLKKDDASPTWIIEAIPTKGALRASLIVLYEDHVTEYPLTIAPAIPNAAATETEFAAFLKDADKTPAQHDVNGDGKYDGVDDFIYTANYLIRQQEAEPAAK